MGTYYLVDYENVDARGLSGIDKIKDTDHVILFYAKGDTQKIPIEIMDKYKSSIDFFRVPKGNQSVDVHLMIYMGYLIGRYPDNRFVIVSKDNGYNVYINTFKQTHSADITKQESISGEKKADKEKKSGAKAAKQKTANEKPAEETSVKADSESKQDEGEESIPGKYAEMDQELMQALCDTKYEGEVAEQVISLCVQYIDEDTALSNIHNAIVEVCSSGDQKDIYKRIKPILQRYHKKDTHVPAKTNQKRKQPVKQARIEKKVVPLLEKQADTSEAAAAEVMPETLAADNIVETEETVAAAANDTLETENTTAQDDALDVEKTEDKDLKAETQTPKKTRKRKKKSPEKQMSEETQEPSEEENSLELSLKEAGFHDDVIAETMRVINACQGEKNYKMTVYRSLIKTYGKEQGRGIYNQIKGSKAI